MNLIVLIGIWLNILLSISKGDLRMKKIIKYGLMWIVATIISLAFLKLANDVGSYWINVSWATAVWFGMETSLLFEIIRAYNETKKHNQKVIENETQNK